jgi:hypothetical protein
LRLCVFARHLFVFCATTASSFARHLFDRRLSTGNQQKNRRDPMGPRRLLKSS